MTARSLFGALLLAASLPAQPRQPAPADPVIRVSVNLVQVDAVVTDSKGRHADDLTADDFEVFEDGKRQRITNFSYVKAPPAPARSLETALAPVRALRPADVRRTIVLVADTEGMAFENFSFVRGAMKKFVDEQMEPGDLVSVMTTSGGAGIFQQFTNDRRQLYASIDHIRFSPWFFNAPLQPIDPVAPSLERDVSYAQRDVAQFRADRVAVGTLNTLNYAIRGLREVPGRKAVALFSEGFQVVTPNTPLFLLEAVNRTIDFANRSTVVIYSIDARGLEYFGPGGFFSHVAQYESNDMLAKGTGGLSFHETNGLAEALQAALDDLSSYYVIGYQPQRKDFDLVAGAPRFHSIRVQVKRPGLHVRTRNGFVGAPDQPLVTQFGSRRAQLRAALLSPFRADGIPVHLSVFYTAGAAKDPKTKRRPVELNAMLAIDARGLKFEDTPNGNKKFALEVVTAAYGIGSQLVAASDRTFTAEVTPERMKDLIASGMVYDMDIEIPKPGPYQVRTALRDSAAERLGSATAFVDLPDFDKPRLALSSVLLRDLDAQRDAALSRQGVIGPGSAVTRIFAPGAVLNYSFLIFGAKSEANVEVRLFRGTERLPVGAPIHLQASAGAPVRAEGDIQLPSELPAGHYTAEFLVYDHPEDSKQPPATQWVDFTIAPL